MNKQFTASEVREYAKYDDSPEREMLNSFADLLEAQEKAVPVAWWNKRTGQILRPHELDAIPDAPHPHSYFKNGFVPLAAHSASAQLLAASVTDAMVERALSAYYVRDLDEHGFAWQDAVGDPQATKSDMRAALEAALAKENGNG